MADLAISTADEADAGRVITVSILYNSLSSFILGETIFLFQFLTAAPLPAIDRYRLEGVRPLSVLTSWSQTPQKQPMKGVNAQSAVPWSPRVESVQGQGATYCSGR